MPYSDELSERIQYQHGMFVTTNSNDVEAQNLIELLRWNDPGLAETRDRHVSRIESLRAYFPDSDEEFVEFLRRDPANLSYISAVEAALGLAFT